MGVSRDHYYRLASELSQERITALKALLEDLIELDTPQEYKYALNRLISGLSSSRAGARIGFSTCLTELLSILLSEKGYTIDEYLQDLEVKLRENTSKARGKDERAYLFGKVFGLQAILESSMFDDITQHTDHFIDILCQIVDISLLKNWIREVCHGAMNKALRNKGVVPNVLSDINTKVMKLILRKLDETNLNFTTEGLMIYLSILPDQRAQIADDAVLNNTWKEGNPLAKGNLPVLTKVLKDSGVVDQESQKGSWHSNLHSVWDLLIVELLTQDQDDDVVDEIKESNKRSKQSLKKHKKVKLNDSTITLPEFWKSVIDEQFFASSASLERKFLGFEILQKVLSIVNQPELIDVLLSPNLMRSLINQTAKSDRFLNKLGKLVLLNLTSLPLRNIKFRIPLLTKLLKSPLGNVHFDRLTNSKTCETIITQNPDQDRIELLEFFINWFNELTPNDDLNKLQNYLIDQILLVVKSSTSDKQQLFNRLCELYIKYGFFQIAETGNDKISELCQERLKSLLTTTSNTRFHTVIDIFQKFETQYKLKFELDSDLTDLKQSTINILTQITKLPNNDKLTCFEMLYSIIIIQLYSGDEDAISLIPELNIAYEKQFTDATSESNEILMDIMLTFLAQRSVLMKQLSMQVWEFLVKSGLRRDNLGQLFDVLLTKENKLGQEKLFGGLDEVVDESGDEKESDESEESDESDDDSESSDDNSIDEVDAKTNVALAEALGIPTSESGEVKFSSSDSDSDSDVESMSDEQMLLIEDQLSAIFKQRQNAMDETQLKSGQLRKNDVLDARQNMIFFKNRILDLLERFYDLDKTNYLNVLIVPVLLELMVLTMDKQLGEKAHKILKNKICKLRITITETDDMTMDELLQIIGKIHSDAVGSSIKAHSLASSQASIFVSKTVVNNFDDMNSVIDIYTKSLKSWSSDKSSKIQSSMYFDFINWINSKRN